MFSPSVLPLTVGSSVFEQRRDLLQQRAQAARVVEILHQVLAGGPQVGEHRHVLRELVEAVELELDAGAPRHRDQVDQRVGRAGQRMHHRDRVVERLRASASRTASDPPTPSRRCAGRSRVAMRGWLESAAGIDAAPGSVRPSVSAAEVMVEAVPITMQCPYERAMPSSTSRQSSSVIVPGAQLRPVLPAVGAGAQLLAVPVAAQHRARRACR